MDIKKSFLGTGWDFPPTFHKEFWGVDMLSDEPDIESRSEDPILNRSG
jgi:hypothetical protein